mgnify:CR=1 FL=1
MAYRNGTYVAFHGQGQVNPTKSDFKYYSTMMGWKEHKHIDFTFNNSHDKTYSVRDSSTWATLSARLRERLNNSKNMVLITTSSTPLDGDGVPFEIETAIDHCEIPIIAAYPEYDQVRVIDNAVRAKWPAALKSRIDSGKARVVHIPFKLSALKYCINHFSHDKLPNSGKSCFTSDWS